MFWGNGDRQRVRALLTAEPLEGRHWGCVVSLAYNHAVIELDRELRYDAAKARVKKALGLEEFALACVEPAPEPPEDAEAPASPAVSAASLAVSAPASPALSGIRL